MIKIKIYVNIQNKGEEDNGFETTIEGNIKPCLELLDFTKEFIRKTQKQEILETNSAPNSQQDVNFEKHGAHSNSNDNTTDCIKTKKKEERQEDGVLTTNISMANKHKAEIDKDYDDLDNSEKLMLEEKFALEDGGVKHG